MPIKPSSDRDVQYPEGLTDRWTVKQSRDSETGQGTLDLQEMLRTDQRAAFEELVRLYRPEIFDLCARISGTRSEAEDLTQETFVRAWEKIDGFRGDAGIRTWLYRIAINLSISFTRRLKRRRMLRGGPESLFPDLPELADPSPEVLVQDRDLAQRAHRLLQELPARQRTAVVLRVIRELPYAKIAETMGISVGGAKANVHQGIKKLRRLLEERE